MIVPFMISPDRFKHFKMIHDKSGVALGIVLGKNKEKLFHIIYYASKTLNEAQKNYTIIEQELLVVVCVFEKFRTYLLEANVVVHINHSKLWYFMENKDAKPN